MFIELFSSPSNYNAETYESAHKFFVKRWQGKLQHSDRGSIYSLLRRNSIANVHGGSNVLEGANSASIGSRRLTNYSVKYRLGSDLFKKFYVEAYSVWISLGHFIIYNPLDDIQSKYGRLTSISQIGTMDVRLTCQPVLKVADNTLLGTWTDAFTLNEDKSAEVIIDTSLGTFDIDVFPMQPDFSRPNYFFACYSIKIM
jgi:hypothetical protein